MSRSKQVLVVEDDPSTRRLVEVLLRRDGHACTVISSGRQAIELLGRNTYDLIIADLQMSDGSGYDVIEHVKAQGLDIPIIVCTASGPKTTEGLPADVVRVVIRKPFNIVELSDAVNEHATPEPVDPPVTVLIVDDDATNRYLMRTFVSPTRVVEAPSAEHALEAIQANRPDAILLDLALPGMPGDELLHRLKDDPATASIPIVIVTSQKLAHGQAHPARDRADGYIYKGDLSRETVRTVMQIVLKTR